MHRRALCVGFNHFENLPDLEYAWNDANELATVFGDTLSFDRVSTFPKISDDRITLDHFRDVLRDICKPPLTQDDVLVFYYSGHGFHVGGSPYTDYLCVTGSDLGNLPDTAMSTHEVLSTLTANSAPTIILILDCCREDLGVGTISQFALETETLARRHGAIAFLSCKEGERSYEATDLQHGIFTFALINIMRNVRPLTLYAIGESLGPDLRALAKELSLPRQTPLTNAPLEKGRLELATGQKIAQMKRLERVLIILGTSNSGKTTIARYLTERYGFERIEMSEFAYRRWNLANRPGTLQDYIEKHLWHTPDSKRILAEDLLSELPTEKRNIVVCGPRAVEEVTTLTANLPCQARVLGIYSSTSQRYARYLTRDGERANMREIEFLRKDMREYSWGLAALIHKLPDSHLIMNYHDAAKLEAQFEEILRGPDWRWLPTEL